MTWRFLILAVLVILCPSALRAEEIGDAVTQVEQVDSLRRALVKGLPSDPAKIDAGTFAAVCKPVGMQIKKVASDRGWNFIQMAEKYRNPDHKPDAAASKAMALFKKDPSMTGFWLTTAGGMRYFRRIAVQQECLACHGAKSARPEFIAKKYPNDRAHGFKVGDLRGVYSVLIPAEKR